MAKKMPLRIIWKMPRSVGFAHDENGEGRPAGEGLTALSLASPRQEIVLYVFYEYAYTPRGPKRGNTNAIKKILGPRYYMYEKS